MVQNPDDVRRAIHSLLNDVVEQSFQLMLEHPAFEAEASAIVHEASESIRRLVAEVHGLRPPSPDAPRLLHVAYDQRLRRISEAAETEAMTYHRTIAGLRAIGTRVN